MCGSRRRTIRVFEARRTPRTDSMVYFHPRVAPIRCVTPHLSPRMNSSASDSDSDKSFQHFPDRDLTWRLGALLTRQSRGTTLFGTEIFFDEYIGKRTIEQMPHCAQLAYRATFAKTVIPQKMVWVTRAVPVRGRRQPVANRADRS